MYLDEKLFRSPECCWTKSGGSHPDVVLSSRIRLARNLEGYPFPPSLSAEKADEVREKVARAFAKSTGKEFSFYPLEQMSPVDREVLVEKHLISTELAQAKPGSALAVSSDASLAVMVNEEDHLRIQCIYPGLQLQKAWEQANGLDDALSAQLPIAFDQDMGYLTACPTNVGTGLRASVMVHLPALALKGSLNQMLQTLSKLGLSVRGMYGEGSAAAGNIFQISNQVTLGKSEQEIIEHLSQVVEQVIAQEKAARTSLLQDNGPVMEDYVWRAYGVLRYARSISSAEAMELLSKVRLGLSLHILPDLGDSLLNQLLVAIQPAFLRRQQAQELTAAQRDIARASVIRQALAGASGATAS